MFGYYMYLGEGRRDWYYDGAHQAAAITLFVLIVFVVINIGFQKKNGVAGYDDIVHETENDRRKRRRWAKWYWALAAVMVLGVALAALARNAMEHPLFFLEAWMIGWLAVFWLLQTWDRWDDGAPRTPAPAGATPPTGGVKPS
jgi:ABC-type Fe3+ transport system permease subunit